ncbi:MAG: hypothetical protein JW965_04300 [Bacteroidales bacterium]|nr:hypothetical protein [Bacteroidales bacterium]
MKTTPFITLVILIPALFLLNGCRSNTKPSDEGTQSQTEAVKPEEAETEPDSRGNKPLGVKSGIIEYTYSGDKTGKSTYYFDDYGMKSAVYADMVMQGEQSQGWTVTIGEDQYMWDLSRPGEGMKAKNPMIKMMMEAKEGDMESYTTSMYEQMGMMRSGTEMYQGKECTVYKGDLGKVLIWKGILMKMEMNIGNVVSLQEVTSIKTNIPVNSKYFRIPDNVTFSEIPGF